MSQDPVWSFFRRKILTNPSGVYLNRTYIFECPAFRLMFHRITGSDYDRWCHDHPFWFISFMVWGAYVEKRRDGKKKRIRKVAPAIFFRRATTQHRLRIVPGKSAWTLVLTGRKKRDWGFWVGDEWVFWKKLAKQTTEGGTTISERQSA